MVALSLLAVALVMSFQFARRPMIGEVATPTQVAVDIIEPNAVAPMVSSKPAPISETPESKYRNEIANIKNELDQLQGKLNELRGIGSSERGNAATKAELEAAEAREAQLRERLKRYEADLDRMLRP